MPFYSKYRRTSYRTRAPSYGAYRRPYAARRRKTRVTRRSGVARPRFSRYRRRSSTSTSCVPSFTKFVYHDTGFTANLAAATYRDYRVFRGNSVYDPDQTGVGLTAYYLTELVGDGKFYQNYCVLGSKITVYATVVNADLTTANIPKVRCILFPSANAAPPITTLGEFDMQHGAKSMTITGDQARRYKLTNYASTKRQLMPGGPTDIEWYGSVSTSPNRQWYWYLIFDAAQIPKTCTVYYDVYIKYYTRMIDRTVVQY